MINMIKMSFSTLCFVLSLCTSLCSTSENVPLLMWSNAKNLSCQQNPQGPGETISSVFTNDYLDCLAKGNPDQVLIFVYDKFGVEDISMYGQTRGGEASADAFANIKKYTSDYPSRIISSVQPAELLEDLVSRMQRLAKASNIKVIRLNPFDRSTGSSTESGLRKNDKEIKHHITNVNGRYVAVITSENTPGEHRRSVQEESVGRRLLTTTEAKNNTSQMLVGDCSLMTFSSVDVAVIEKTSDGDHKYFSKLKMKTPSAFKDECNVNSSAKIPTGNVSMTIDFVGTNGSALESAKIEMVFQNLMFPVSAMYWWRLKSVKVFYSIAATKANKAHSYNVSLAEKTFIDYISAPFGYSFACSYTDGMVYVDHKAKSPEISGPSIVVVHFQDWQIQPFGANINPGTGNTSFSHAVDCVGWYTEPIITGLLVSFLLIILFSFGLCMASGVTTMDRFDNPKAKSIIVSQDNN